MLWLFWYCIVWKRIVCGAVRTPSKQSTSNRPTNNAHCETHRCSDSASLQSFQRMRITGLPLTNQLRRRSMFWYSGACNLSSCSGLEAGTLSRHKGPSRLSCWMFWAELRSCDIFSSLNACLDARRKTPWQVRLPAVGSVPTFYPSGKSFIRPKSNYHIPTLLVKILCKYCYIVSDL